MRIEAWIESRDEAGTLANVARRVIEKDATYKSVERTLQHLFVLEALFRNDWNLTRTAKAIGVSTMTIRRALRAMGIKPADIPRIAQRMGRADAGTAA